jgi:hypothetical protein
MLARLRRRRLVRWVAFTLFSIALFVGGVWLAVHLAERTAVPGVRVTRGAPHSRPPSVQRTEEGVTIRQPAGPGGPERDLEVKNTEQGLLIRPVPGKR